MKETHFQFSFFAFFFSLKTLSRVGGKLTEEQKISQCTVGHIAL
jgi:hypothetical protein